MKVDENIRTFLVSALESKMEYILNNISSVICILRNLPISGNTCYFCQLYTNPDTEDIECKKCEYGKIHGICNDWSSDWYNLYDSVLLLTELFENLIRYELCVPTVNNMQDIFENLINETIHATTVEEIMRAKTVALIQIIDSLPKTQKTDFHIFKVKHYIHKYCKMCETYGDPS